MIIFTRNQMQNTLGVENRFFLLSSIMLQWKRWRKQLQRAQAYAEWSWDSETLTKTNGFPHSFSLIFIITDIAKLEQQSEDVLEAYELVLDYSLS